jgi:hypothetical protein
MSIMEYDLSRRYSLHNDLSYSNYYFDGRNAPLALSHHARFDPSGYSMGGPVGGGRGQLGMERDEHRFEHGGHSRRRIAVAVSVKSFNISPWEMFCGALEDSIVTFVRRPWTIIVTNAKDSAHGVARGRSNAVETQGMAQDVMLAEWLVLIRACVNFIA